MSEIQTNTNSGLDFFNMPPPGAAGDSYTNLVVDSKGVPLGRASAVANLTMYFGYSDKDSVGNALDEVMSLGSQLNLAIMSHLTSDTAVLNYLNTIDPTMPTLPPIKAFLLIAERALQQGKIGGFQLAIVENKANIQGKEELVKEQIISEDDTWTNKTKKDEAKTINSDSAQQEEEKETSLGLSNVQTTFENLNQNSSNSAYGFGAFAETSQSNTQNQAAQKEDTKIIEAGKANVVEGESYYIANLGKATGGNPWLASNMYTFLLSEFMEIQRRLMQNKVVQGQVQVICMNLIVTIAQSTAEKIMEIAKMNQLAHIITAVMAGVALAISIGSFAFGAIGHAKGSAFALDRGSMMGQMGVSLEKLVTAAVQAGIALPKAELEGIKEMLQAYQQLEQHILQKSGESFNASAEEIQQLLQTLDKIREGLQQAINNALHK